MSYTNFLFIFLSLILIIIVYRQYNEGFVNCNKNLTISNKNLYINNDQILEIDNLNCNKLCIKEPDGNIECISKAQLFNALNLPAIRRHAVCLDDSCLSRYDIQKLNGEKSVQFKSSNNGNCVKYGILPNTSTTIRKKYLWEKGGGGRTKWDMVSGKKKGCVKGNKKNCRRRRNIKRKWIKSTRRPSRRYKRSFDSPVAVHSLLQTKCEQNENDEQSSFFELAPGKKVEDITLFNYNPNELGISGSQDYNYGNYSSRLTDKKQFPIHVNHEKIGK